MKPLIFTQGGKRIATLTPQEGKDGEVFTLDRARVFAMGGGQRRDTELELLGEDETALMSPSKEEMLRAVKNLEENEYNVDIILENMPYELIRWIDNEGLDPKKLNLTSDTKRIQDLKGKHLLLFSSEWNITWALEHNKELILTDFSKN